MGPVVMPMQPRTVTSILSTDALMSRRRSSARRSRSRSHSASSVPSSTDPPPGRPSSDGWNERPPAAAAALGERGPALMLRRAKGLGAAPGRPSREDDCLMPCPEGVSMTLPRRPDPGTPPGPRADASGVVDCIPGRRPYDGLPTISPGPPMVTRSSRARSSSAMRRWFSASISSAKRWRARGNGRETDEKTMSRAQTECNESNRRANRGTRENAETMTLPFVCLALSVAWSRSSLSRLSCSCLSLSSRSLLASDRCSLSLVFSSARLRSSSCCASLARMASCVRTVSSCAFSCAEACELWC